MSRAPLPPELADVLPGTEEMWRAVAESPFDYVFMVDRQGTYLYMNQTAPGLRSEELLGKARIFDFLEPEDHPRVHEALRTVFEDGRPTYYEAHVRFNDTWYASVLAPVRRDGTVVAASIMSRDCTAQKRAEEASRQADARYRMIVEGTRDGVWLIDTNAVTTFVNARLADMLGYTADEMLGRDLLAFVAEDLREQTLRQLADRWRGEHEVHDFRFVRKDGSEVYAIVSANPVLGADGRVSGAMAIVTDVTERKRWERQVAQAEKMQVVGRLAGGVAHEFNNQLTTIIGFAGLLERALPGQTAMLSDVGHILEAAERASALVRQLLTFARRQEARPRVVNVADQVASLRSMLESVLPGDVRLTLRLDDAACFARLDPAQLEQVLLNLIINARDAIVARGNVVVTVQLEPAGAQHEGPLPCVLLKVADDGTGMSTQLLEHIFEPFFTTKSPDKGSGLGLSIVYSVVQQNGGTVSVDSELGRGTEFSVRFPAVDAAVARSQAPGRSEPTRGCETLLLVEDDALVRAGTQRTLQALGYTVMTASCGAEALERWQSCPDIAAVISDVIMPQMNGPELAERLRSLRPDVRVLFLSGYAGPARATRGLVASLPVLDKPYTLHALAHAVRSVLDAP
jgi:two-component system cell cycle sensor histidine kinase/response regulator CckA